MRINAQVVKVADGFHLWSQTYDRDLTDIFAVQDEIAREVVKAMKVKLLAGKGPGEQRGTNPEACAQFLLGNQLWRDAGNSGAMLAAYEKAVALDPTWAPAWARLASARATWVRGETRAGAAARHLRALEAAEKAVAIDPGLAVAYAVRGNLRMDYQWNWDGARSDFERALALAPADAIATKGYGRLLACLGHGADAVRLQRKAVELDPLLWTNWSWLGDTYISQGQHALGRSAIQHALELSSFNKPFLIHKMIASYLLEGQVALAAAWVEKLKDEDDRLLWIQRHQAALPSTLTEQSRRVTLATRPISPAGI